jgi:spore germination protein KC
MRPNTFLLISDGEASDLLSVDFENEKLPAMGLSKVIKAGDLTSHLLEVNLQDFTSRLLSCTAAPVAPLFKVSSTNGKKTAEIEGMAVFERCCMVGKLEKTETRGLLWALGKVKSGVINVDTPDGKGNAAFEIIKAKSKAEPELRDGKMFMKVKVQVDTSLVEQNTSQNLATLPMFEKLQKLQQKVIEQEIRDCFKKSKKLNLDIYGFGDMLKKKNHAEWEKLKDQWDKAYQDVELKLDVKVKIRRTDLIVKPATSEEEEGK